MEERDIDSVEQEVQETIPPTLESEVKPIEEKPQVSASNENHIRKLREQKEELERSLRESYAFIEQLQKSQRPVPEPDLSEDDFVDGKTFAQVKKEISQVRQELAETRKLSVRARLNSEMPDITEVLSSENVARLETEHPEFSPMIIATTDQYTQFKAMYKLIKKFGIYTPKEVQAHNPNAKKPIPTAAIAREDSPLKYASGFRITEEEKAEMRKFNKEAMR